MARSFRKGDNPPPVEFRTPSPPLGFYEPISPASSTQSRRTPPAPEYEQITPERVNGFEEELRQLTRAGRAAGYNKSSSISTFRPPSHTQRSTQWNSHVSRSRSDHKIRATLGSGNDNRLVEEAELLLNFTREARFLVPRPATNLESSTQHRSISFNSYHQTRPSLADLEALGESKSHSGLRPSTQNGLKSIWKDIPHSHNESSRRASHGSHLSDRTQMPPPELKNSSRITPDSNEANKTELKDDSLAVDESAIRSASVESKQELQEDKMDTTHIIPIPDNVGVDDAPSKAPPTATEVAPETETVSAPVQAKKNEDTPSICASCNFARNTAENEADSEMTSWISCDGCRSWFHFACAGFNSVKEVRLVDKFRCKKCKPIHGPTTFVRKSARAHTSIDYAGLNEGIIKTSDTDPEHHYVKDFKNGKKFTPETFARMHPELVTAEFFERGEGMKEPIVIPAELNPRPRPIPNADIPENVEDSQNRIEEIDTLHDRQKLDTWLADTFEYEIVQDQGQDALDMVIPQDLTVRKVSELYGPDEKLEVIDVKSQNGEDKPWTLRRWADYYESTGEKIVRNVISLEVSQSKLGRLIRRPKIVRDLDLQDSVWPAELQAKGEFPKVQFYCLMSVADCYTDFHIDFGGSSVYYHILRGKKTFFFIPPTEKHLKQYEEWCNSPAQNWTFLGDQTNQCYRVDLSEGDTMLIPAGWIHAVWTPADSLVIGGNFLTRLHYPLQIRVAQIEKTTNVARKFRYPYFQKLLWYSAIRYMDEDPIPEIVEEKLNSGQKIDRPAPSANDYQAWGENSVDDGEYYHARYYPQAELDGLPELFRYLWRTALIAGGHLTEGISTDTRNAVKRSIPKGHNHGEPVDAIKKFALWCTWKRGNETIPFWAYPDHVPQDVGNDQIEKHLSTKARKKLDREAASQAIKIAPDRQSTRPRSQPQTLLNEIMANQAATQAAKATASAVESQSSTKRKLSETMTPVAEVKTKRPRTSNSARTGSGRKTACEACRKSRRACKHGQNSVLDQPADTSLVTDFSMAFSGTPTKSGNSIGSVGPYDSMDFSPAGTDIKAEHSSDSMMIDPAQMGAFGVAANDANNKSHQKPSGRTKACKDCRKSKRRCVHDELGNEDPKKLAEAAIPRPAAKRKKPNQTDGFSSTSQAKGYSISPTQHHQVNPYSTEQEVTQDVAPQEYPPGQDYVNGTEPAVPQDASIAGEEFDINSLIDPMLLAQGTDDSIGRAIAHSAEQALSMLNTSPHSESKYDPQLQNIPPAVDSSLVSPPDSTNDDQEGSLVQDNRSKGFTPPTTNSVSSRHSSRPTKVITRFTPDSGLLRQPSLSSGGAVSSRDSVSPTMSLPPANTTPLKRSKSRTQSEVEADEASLKLIREMQAQDLGLRRRG